MILILCQSAGGLFVLLKKLKNLSCGGVTVKGESEVPPGVCKPESKSDCLQLGVYYFFIASYLTAQTGAPLKPKVCVNVVCRLTPLPHLPFFVSLTSSTERNKGRSAETQHSR